MVVNLDPRFGQVSFKDVNKRVISSLVVLHLYFRLLRTEAVRTKPFATTELQVVLVMCVNRGVGVTRPHRFWDVGGVL